MLLVLALYAWPESRLCTTSSKELFYFLFLDLTHSSDGYHSCSTCGRTFSHIHNMKRHLNAVCNKKPPGFFCSYCPFSSNRRDNLKRHVVIMHKVLL